MNLKYKTLILVCLIVPIPAFAEMEGSITINLIYSNGDRADFYLVSLKIFQDQNGVPFREIESISANPFTISQLPIGHQYKIEVYSNGMFATVGYVDMSQPQQNLDLKLPLPGGMRVNVFYNDKLTPISGASIFVKSYQNKTWANGITGANGQTMRFWISPTIAQNDNYTIIVKIGRQLSYSYSPAYLIPGVAQEIKVVTPWPPIIDSLITLHVYNNQSKLVTPSDGKFAVDIFDMSHTKVSESQVSHRGEAYFYNLKVGDYILKAINLNDGSLWGSSTITLDGARLNFEITENSTRVMARHEIPQNPVISSSNFTNQNVVENQTAQKSVIQCSCIAFVVDNIQDYWLDNVQAKVLDAILQKNASLTLGVIAHAFGNDTLLIDEIKPKVGDGLIEPAINGWTFEDFTTFDRSQQTQLLTLAKNRISEVLGVTPDVFLPPYGKTNNDTYEAAITNGIDIVSGVQPNPMSHVTDNVQRLSTMVFNGNSEDQNLNVTDKPISEIQKSIENNGYAVMMINFQDYAKSNGTTLINEPNMTKIGNLQSLIDNIKEKGYRIVTIKDIPSSTDFKISQQTTNSLTIPEFPFAVPVLLISVVSVIAFYRLRAS